MSSGDASVISNQVIGWPDIMLLLVFNLIFFVPFILSKEYRWEETVEVVEDEDTVRL